MIIREVYSKTILSKSKVYDYVVNPYVGCEHACTYCYAHFMKRFTGHKEPWGEFVDVRVNAPELLERDLARARPGRVWLSGVCDAYQPLEEKYGLARKCLAILVRAGRPITVQTKSPLVLRDLDLLQGTANLEVGLSLATADDNIREIFEPGAPPIAARIAALDKLHRAGIRTYAMIAPLLPNADDLGILLRGKVDHVLIDRMNYHYADWVYKKHGLEAARSDIFFSSRSQKLASALEEAGIEYRVIF